MRIAFRTRPILFLALLATAGCGINQLRVQYAGSVATKGKAAATASREFLDRVEAARLDLNIELVALDPACARQGMMSRVRLAPLLGPRAPARAWLCVPTGWTAQGIDIQRGPIDSQLRPSLALIEALAAYAGAIGEIVDEDAADPAKAITDALATALAVQGAVEAVVGTEVGPQVAATDPRVGAVKGLVTFLARLQHEENQVRRLRQLVADSPGGVNPIIASLRGDVERWETSRLGDAGVARRINEMVLSTVVNRQPPATPEIRRTALRALYARIDANEAGRLLAPAVTNLLDKVAQADANFRRILQRDPQLNEQESRQVAEFNRQNIVAALEQVTALVTAFRGV